jgi:hypothetical protein
MLIKWPICTNIVQCNYKVHRKLNKTSCVGVDEIYKVDFVFVFFFVRLSKKRSVHDYATYTDDGGESAAELMQAWTPPQLNVSSPIKQRSVSLVNLIGFKL